MQIKLTYQEYIQIKDLIPLTNNRYLVNLKLRFEQNGYYKDIELTESQLKYSDMPTNHTKINLFGELITIQLLLERIMGNYNHSDYIMFKGNETSIPLILITLRGFKYGIETENIKQQRKVFNIPKEFKL